MKKLINRPESVVEEMAEGLVAAFPGLRRLPGRTVLVRADIEGVRHGQVALISGGGSGHEPAHAGYVGRGMLSGAVLGDVFTSPSPDAILAAIEAVAGTPGVLLIVKNYTGDRLNFADAAERARGKGIAVETVVVADDAALAGTDSKAGARGLAGTILVHKVAGAAAEAGLSLAEVAAEARAAAEAVATMGVALSACTVPAAGKPGFSLADDEIELGLGIHGEPGIRTSKVTPADDLVDLMLDSVILPRQGLAPATPLALMVNNLGATPTMELAVVARRAIATLEGQGFPVERVYVGTFLSALEMAGVSLSVLALDDARLARLDAPTDAPAWPNAAARPRNRTRASLRLAAPGVVPRDDLVEPSVPPPVTPEGKALEASLATVVATLIASADAFNDLDRHVGDGDLGTSLARGARAIARTLNAQPEPTYDRPADCLATLIPTLRDALGGSSGPLFSALLEALVEGLRGRPDLPDHGPMHQLARGLRKGCVSISQLGGAMPGDRTLLDALWPIGGVFEQCGREGFDWPETLARAAEAAEAGASATSTMPAKFGRASYLGARALGHPDPGAVAIATIFRSLADRFGNGV